MSNYQSSHKTSKLINYLTSTYTASKKLKFVLQNYEQNFTHTRYRHKCRTNVAQNVPYIVDLSQYISKIVFRHNRNYEKTKNICDSPFSKIRNYLFETYPRLFSKVH